MAHHAVSQLHFAVGRIVVRSVPVIFHEVADLVEGVLGELRGAESVLTEGQAVGDLLDSLPPIDSERATR